MVKYAFANCRICFHLCNIGMMATWEAVQGTLLEGANQLFAGVMSIRSVQDAQPFLSRALTEYPDPAVKVLAAAFVASIIVFALSIPTKNYR